MLTTKRNKLAAPKFKLLVIHPDRETARRWGRLAKSAATQPDHVTFLTATTNQEVLDRFKASPDMAAIVWLSGLLADNKLAYQESIPKIKNAGYDPDRMFAAIGQFSHEQQSAGCNIINKCLLVQEIHMALRI